MNVSMKWEYRSIACPPENTHPNMALNNQADKMTWPIGNGQPLSPATPTLPRWVYDEERACCTKISCLSPALFHEFPMITDHSVCIFLSPIPGTVSGTQVAC